MSIALGAYLVRRGISSAVFFTPASTLKPLDFFASGESGLAGWLANKRRFPESPELEGKRRTFIIRRLGYFKQKQCLQVNTMIYCTFFLFGAVIYKV